MAGIKAMFNEENSFIAYYVIWIKIVSKLIFIHG
jgi:hypothetical protein